MEYLAKRRENFFKRLARRALRRLFHVTEEERLREDKHVVAAKIGVGLFARYQEHVAVRKPLAAVEIHFLLAEPDLAGIGRMGIAVEVSKNGHVDSE